MKIAAIIQARTSSTRLPNKAMAEICGKPMLEHIIERLRESKTIGQIIVATTTNAKDKAIVELCKKLKIECFAGSEEDVLSRYVDAAEKFKVDVIVRVCADQPFISTEGIDEAVEIHIKKNADFTNNRYLSGVEHGYAPGTCVEVVSFSALQRAAKLAKKADEREHVTLFLRRNPKMFKTEKVQAPALLYRPNYKLNVDEAADLELCKAIFKNLYAGKPIKAAEVIKFLDENPEVARMNAGVKETKVEL